MINKNFVTTKKYEDKNPFQIGFLVSYSHLITAYGCIILPFDNSLMKFNYLNIEVIK